MVVFVVTGRSESGDDYLAIFQKSPTPQQLSDLVHSWDGDDKKEGPGFDGSYVHLNVWNDIEFED